MAYTFGLHIIVDINTSTDLSLYNGNDFKYLLQKTIKDLELNEVGTVLHNFDSGGFTIAVCLTESHICAHTWPEYNRATLDIYLSNTYGNNDDKGRKLLKICTNYFDSKEVKVQEIFR